MELTDDELEIVTEILRNNLPNVFVAAFGSRVKGTRKKHADLDLLIRAKTPIPFEILGKIREAFSDSDLRFRVDIVDAHAASEDFVKQAESQAVIIQKGR